MSEKVYACLLRLYPYRFRRMYGEAALQLFRDRSRDERGFVPRVMLWIDLLMDLLVSLPGEYRHIPAEIAASPSHSFDGAPGFHLLESNAPRFSAFLYGGVLSIAAFASVSILIMHSRGYGEIPSWHSNLECSGQFRSSAPAHPFHRIAGSSKDALVQPVTLLSDPVRLESTLPRPTDYPLMRMLAIEPSGLPQSQAHSLERTAGAGMLVESVIIRPELNATERHRVVDGAIAALRQYYLFPNVAENIAAALLAHENSGDDEGATDGRAFATLLTNQMRDVSHDKHLRVTYSSEPVSDGPQGPGPDRLAQYRQDMEQHNCTFEKVEVLPHNIGYLKLNSFPDPAVCQAKAVTAMAALNQADAIIFDLRDNGGGSPVMVSLMAGYLFARPTHINDIYSPREGLTQQFWTKPVAGNKLADKPAYVLTSANTFSGAEEFSYDLKMLRRATLIGETTAGGAHLTDWRPIDAHFGVAVPHAKPVNPVSKTDWEGTGVTPDVQVRAANALDVAEKLAVRRLQKEKSSQSHDQTRHFS